MRKAVFILTIWTVAGCADEHKFVCQKQPGNWVLVKNGAVGMSQVACFGGYAIPEDNERLCRETLKSPWLEGKYDCARVAP